MKRLEFRISEDIHLSQMELSNSKYIFYHILYLVFSEHSIFDRMIAAKWKNEIFYICIVITCNL